MSFRLARFREPMSQVAKTRRARRRKTNGKRVKFSHVSQKGEIYFITTKTHEIYTQSDLKKFFGLQPKVNKRIHALAAERKLDYELTHDE